MTKENKQIIAVIRGLLRIAKTAMPDTYYASDTRVKKAQALIVELQAHDYLNTAQSIIGNFFDRKGSSD